MGIGRMTPVLSVLQVIFTAVRCTQLSTSAHQATYHSSNSARV